MQVFSAVHFVRRTGLFFLLAAASTLALPEAASAQEQLRTALVIGNGAYQGLPVPANPPNDSRDMAAVLRRMGFDVSLLVDATNIEMDEAVYHFGRSPLVAERALAGYRSAPFYESLKSVFRRLTAMLPQNVSITITFKTNQQSQALFWASQWGPDAEILSPPELRQRAAEWFRKTAANYS